MGIIQRALKVMEADFKGADCEEQYSTSEKVSAYCRLQLGGELDEVFGAMFMDNSNRLIAFEKLFRGTINEANVFLRPIARKVLELNASRVIFTHNHPSGNCKPSEADIVLTKHFSAFLKQIDCKVLDHIVVSATNSVSMLEEGLM
jgi:DNA repair protein RadC